VTNIDFGSFLVTVLATVLAVLAVLVTF